MDGLGNVTAVDVRSINTDCWWRRRTSLVADPSPMCAKGNERLDYGTYSEREEGCRKTVVPAVLVRTSNILIGQWLHTRRNVIRETMYLFSFSLSVPCRNSSSLKVIALRTNNVGSRQQQQLRRGCCVARPRQRHWNFSASGYVIPAATEHREIAQKWY